MENDRGVHALIEHIRFVEPDWNAVRKHIDIYVPTNADDYAHQTACITRFAYLQDSLRTERLEKVHFETVDHIPPCIKYRRPASLTFIDGNSKTSPTTLFCLELNILRLIEVDYDHFLDLHPVRYDKVKEAISKGEVDMPLVSICSEQFPRVDDGRHRLIALHKFGIKSAQVLVPADQSNEIRHQLNVNTVRRGPSRGTGVCRADMTLQDFFRT